MEVAKVGILALLLLLLAKVKSQESVQQNKQNESVAQCGSDQFWNSLAAKCANCTECASRPHQRMVRNCSFEGDAICACKQNFFYETTKQTCQQCQICVFGHLKRCTAVTDSHCKKAPKFKPFGRRRANSRSRSKAAQNGPDDEGNEEEEKSIFENGSKLVPIYCGFLGIIVVLLAAQVLFRHWKLRKDKSKAGIAIAPPHARPLLTEQPATTQQQQQQQHQQQQQQHQQQQAIFVPIFRPLPAQQSSQMAAGYDVSLIRGRKRPVRALLNLWNRDGNYGDVVSLIQALQAVGWADLTDIVCDEVESV